MMLCQNLPKEDLKFFNQAVGKNWIASIKYDGVRCQLHFIDGKLKLINRSGRNITHQYPELHSFDPGIDVVLDGELCVFKGEVSAFNEGIAFRSHCQSQDAISSSMQGNPVTYVAFDILRLRNDDLRGKPWHFRHKALELLFEAFKGDPVLKIEEFSRDIYALWDKACQRGEEGIILKEVNSLYLEGKRSSLWRKVKDLKEVDIRISSYGVNPAGIRVESDEGIAIQVSGFNAPPVKSIMDRDGEAIITVRHLGVTASGKLRQPTYMKLVEKM